MFQAQSIQSTQKLPRFHNYTRSLVAVAGLLSISSLTAKDVSTPILTTPESNKLQLASPTKNNDWTSISLPARPENSTIITNSSSTEIQKNSPTLFDPRWLALIANLSVIPLVVKVFAGKKAVNNTTFHILSINGIALTTTAIAAQGITSGSCLVSAAGTLNSFLLYIGAHRQKLLQNQKHSSVQNDPQPKTTDSFLWPDGSNLKSHELACRNLAIGALLCYGLSKLPALSSYMPTSWLNAAGMFLATTVFSVGIYPQIKDLWFSTQPAQDQSLSLTKKIVDLTLSGLPWHTFTVVRGITFAEALAKFRPGDINSYADIMTQFFLCAGNVALSAGVVKRDLLSASSNKLRQSSIL